MTRLRAVFDASVLVRAALSGERSALEWTRRAEDREVEARAPGLVWGEVVHALTRYVRGRALEASQAQERLLWLLRLPIRSEPVERIAPAALPFALASGLSGYDACYLALADALEAVLVTADRRLAAVAPRAELIA